ncbi:MAG TPA: N-formylglutamate amidohydrolase [Stellaceae bacterium]|nr:N-formylglutamate amidohydrolase [Stellaceae bacterium]
MPSTPHTIPGVLYRRDPEVPEVPLVFDSPHSGVEYPRDFDFICPLEMLRTAEDTYVDELYAAAPAHGATLIGAYFPRSYIDANRNLGDIDQELLDTPWPGEAMPGEKSRLGMGLIRRLAVPKRPVYGRKLGVAEVKARIDRYYEPYHRELAGVADRLHARFGGVWHVNCHSMKSVSNAMASEGAGVVRGDFVLGDRDGTTCAPELTEFVRHFLRARGYDVKVNDPYKGVELVRRHGRPREQRHSLQIEVNRKLYMDEASFERNANFPRLKADLDALVAALAGFASERALRR